MVGAYLMTAALALVPSVARAGDGWLLHPEGPGRWRVRVGVGAELDLLPRALVESELRVVPRVSVRARLGLPWGFSADLGVQAIVLDNAALAGLAWSRSFGAWSLQVQSRFGMTFGWVFLEGFDLSFRSTLWVPGLALGLRAGPHRVSLVAEGYVVLSQTVNVGTATVSRQHDQFEAFGLTLSAETPLGPRGRFYVGVTAFIAQPDWQLWLAFSDVNQPSLYPRFQVGYVF